MKSVLSLSFVFFFAAFSVSLKTYVIKTGTDDKMEFQLFSEAFKDGDFIPAKYTCDGINISPPLNWVHPPKDTKSFALINDDPDAPAGDWVHWVVYNIPSAARELKENASKLKHLPHNSIEGINDFRQTGYGGPCPPSGIHRYFFKLYALDTLLNLKQRVAKKELLDAMEGHILALTELVGKYQRQR